MDVRQLKTPCHHGHGALLLKILIDLLELFLSKQQKRIMEVMVATWRNIECFMFGQDKQHGCLHMLPSVACGKILHSHWNCCNSCYSIETSDYFNCDPMSLDKCV
jgi:hypothetical protein